MLPYILSRGALWAKGRLYSLLRKSYLWWIEACETYRRARAYPYHVCQSHEGTASAGRAAQCSGATRRHAEHPVMLRQLAQTAKGIGGRNRRGCGTLGGSPGAAAGRTRLTSTNASTVINAGRMSCTGEGGTWKGVLLAPWTVQCMKQIGPVAGATARTCGPPIACD